MSFAPSGTSGRTRRVRVIAVGAVALLAVLAIWLLWPRPAPKTPPPHRIAVTAFKAAAQDFQVTISGLGAAQAWTSDVIFAQVSGKLLSVDFAEGSTVRKGQLLAEVDPRPYQAMLLQAEGTLRRDQAAQAGARRDLERYQRLSGEGGVSRQQLEDQVATVGADEGTVEIDRGAVAAARINLEFCRIVSPIDGRAGVRLVDPGNLVTASGSTGSAPNTSSASSSAPAASASASSSSSSNGPSAGGSSSGGAGIVVINQIQPIAVTFTVPQSDFQHLLLISEGFSKPLPVQALSQETGAVLGQGQLRVADNRVDQATGSVELKARFENAGPKLWPGQFVNVSLGLQTLRGVIVVPLAAVNRGPKGEYVFVVGRDGKAVIRPVDLGPVQGQSVVIQKGLQPGELVIIDGQMTLNNGSLVQVSRSRTGRAS